MADHPDGPVDELPNSMQFSTTHWSLVLAAGRRGTVESDSALERLCKSYWPTLYAYVRRRVSDLHEAQDLTQAFFERLLDRDYLADADPRCGRFRAFLLTAFKRFLSKEWDKAKAPKRGGDRRRMDFDFVSQDAMEPADQLTPDKLFERQWAVTLLGRVMQRLQRDMERRIGSFGAIHVFGSVTRGAERHFFLGGLASGALSGASAGLALVLLLRNPKTNETPTPPS